MTKVIIVHGWGADSLSNWFPWLQSELEKKGFEVLCPDFPTTQTPQLTDWITHLNKLTRVDGETIMVGHSLGAPFILRYLEQLPRSTKVKAAFLVSGFERSLGFPETDNFVIKPFNWDKIKKSCNKFYVINSDDDPYIPLSIGKDLAKKLGVPLTIEHNAGHINAPGGFLSYPKVRDLVIKLK